MKKLIAVLLGMTLFASTASAAPFHVRGEFNSWTNNDPMDDLGGGHFQDTITGLTPGNYYEYKVATTGWESSWPGSNGRILAPASGELTFHFYEGSASDGWLPAADRVGYSGSTHGWEVMGSFPNSNFTTGIDMTHLGGNVYQTSFVIAAAGTYDYKFRQDGDWAISIGDNFGNSAANVQIVTTQANELVQFTLDLPGGRHQAVAVPEPAALSLLGLGALAMTRRRR